MQALQSHYLPGAAHSETVLKQNNTAQGCAAKRKLLNHTVHTRQCYQACATVLMGSVTTTACLV